MDIMAESGLAAGQTSNYGYSRTTLSLPSVLALYSAESATRIMSSSLSSLAPSEPVTPKLAVTRISTPL